MLKIYEVLLQNKENWWEKRIALVCANNPFQAENLAIQGLEHDFYTDGTFEIIAPDEPKVLSMINLGD